MAWSTVVLVAAGAWAMLVGWFDWQERRIPNLLSLGAWCVALPPLATQGHSWLGEPWQGVGWTMLLAGVLGFPAYTVRKLGAGDVKLMVAMALLGTLDIFLVTYAVAGALALVTLMLRAAQMRGNTALWPAADRLIISLLGQPDEGGGNIRIPFGALLSAGWILALWLKA